MKFKEMPKIKVGKEFEPIYKTLMKSQLNINELSRILNLDIWELNTKLTMMELNGLIEILPGSIVKIKE